MFCKWMIVAWDKVFSQDIIYPKKLYISDSKMQRCCSLKICHLAPRFMVEWAEAMLEMRVEVQTIS